MSDEAVCPNGHPFPRMVPVACEDCGAAVVCEPTCYGMEMHRTLEATEVEVKRLREEMDRRDEAQIDVLAGMQREITRLRESRDAWRLEAMRQHDAE